MTLQEIAKLDGTTTHRCGEEWGGTWGYGSETGANINGFKTEEEAIRHAVLSRFDGNGELGTLCFELLRKHKANKETTK